MGRAYSDIAFTPAVRAMQTRMGTRAVYAALDRADDRRDALTFGEVEFIHERDAFYQATVYSIASDPNRRDIYEITVLREEEGSGGSRALGCQCPTAPTLTPAAALAVFRLHGGAAHANQVVDWL